MRGLGALIAAEYGDWEGPRYLEEEIFGTGDPDRIATCVDRFCSRALGSSIERYEFFATSVMSAQCGETNHGSRGTDAPDSSASDVRCACNLAPS